MSVNWDKRFLELSEFIAKWSKDRSTGVGVVIADSDNRVVSMGYNGFPSGFNDDLDYRHNRPQKYLYTEHAERNAIYNAARAGLSIKNCTMYLMWFPCADCARAIIQSGISTLVCRKPDFSNETWGNSFAAAFDMLNECKIKLIYIDEE